MSRIAIAAALFVSLSSFAAAAERAPVAADMPASTEGAPIPVTELDVRTALFQHRKANLALFRQYEKDGVFPDNTYVPGKRNVWRDEHGHFCAAANLVVKSGNLALATKVAEQANFIVLGKVTQGPVMDWILTSGFTQEEIALIQEPYSMVSPRPRQPVDGTLRRAEDARLHKLYQRVAATLDKQQSRSLDLAAHRLFTQHPELAASLVSGDSPVE